MSYSLQLQDYIVGGQPVRLFVPEPGGVQRLYRQQKAQEPATPFPYWTQVWPAALALGTFIADHPQYVQGKEVLELAAGLGLPSFLSSRYARTVCTSDYLPEAVEVLKSTAAANGLRNVECRLLNWHRLPNDLRPEVLMLSDINYDPSEFETLRVLVTGFLEKGTTVLLSTPQRLMAKPFIGQLQPWCRKQQEMTVPHNGEQIPVTVFVLQQTND